MKMLTTRLPNFLCAGWRAALLGLIALGIAACGKPKTAEETPPGSGDVVAGVPGTGAAGGGTAAMAGQPSGSGAPGGAGATSGAPAAGMTAGTNPAGTAAAGDPNATAGVLIQDLIAKLRAGDMAGFLAVAGTRVATGPNQVRLQGLMIDRGYRVSESNPFTVTDRGEAAKTVAVKVVPKAEDAALGELAIELDLAREQGARWGVAELRVPDILELAAAKMGTGGAAGGPGDPLGVAGQFLDAVVKKDFATARRLVDTGKLSDEKLAALFIVVEEGSFKPHRDKPLISTMARNNNAWVIARLESSDHQSDFGMEMTRTADASPWQIVGLNFSKLIQNVAAQSGAGDIAYSPLQKDLKGGEQIVIYFEFDGTGVNPRAEKQLRIIGDILRADASRTLTINGYADALGEDRYNAELSERRATSIRGFLASYGIPPKQVVTQGFGESAPKAPNVNPDGTDNPSGRAQNRRAAVYLKF